MESYVLWRFVEDWPGRTFNPRVQSSSSDGRPFPNQASRGFRGASVPHRSLQGQPAPPGDPAPSLLSLPKIRELEGQVSQEGQDPRGLRHSS